MNNKLTNNNLILNNKVQIIIADLNKTMIRYINKNTSGREVYE